MAEDVNQVNHIKIDKRLQQLPAAIPSTVSPTACSKDTLCNKYALPLSITAKLDSGASKSYFQPTNNNLQNLTPLHNQGPCVTFPNGTITNPTHIGQIPLPHLTAAGKSAYVLPSLSSANLISVGQLCDDGCEVLFNRDQAIVSKNKRIVTTGNRNFRDGLWDVHIKGVTSVSTPASQPIQYANAVITLQQTKTELLNYLQACLFSPVKSTVLRAILNNNLITFPGLDNISFVRKHLQPTLDTFAGHQKQERKHIQSTKLSSHTLTIKDRLEQDKDISLQRDHFPVPDFPNAKSYHCYVLLVPFETTTKAYGDLTGKFPIESSRGNKYLLIVYDYDSNAILAEALQNRQAGTIKHAWIKLHNKLASKGAAPKLYIMDNEASLELKSAMTKTDIRFELVPPMVHRRNAAERAIQTFKDHFIAGLASVDPQFPMQEWDRLLPQAIITLNLLRNARVNPKLSAYAYLFGVFDFNKTPLAPPGTKVSVHHKANQRASWARRGTPAWYVGPALEHYRCVTCYDPQTKQERICDSVEFLPHKIPFPKVTVEDFLRQAVTDIVSLLRVPPSTTSPTLQYGDSTLNAFRAIAESLRRADPIPPSPNTSTISVIDKLASTQTSVVESLPSPIVAPPRVHHGLAPRVVPLVPRPNIVVHNAPSPRVSTSVPASKVSPNVLSPSTKQSSFPKHRYDTRFKTKNLLAQNISTDNFNIENKVNHIYNEQGKRETVDSLITGPNKDIWMQSLSNEFGRLAQSNDAGVRHTDAIDFISKTEVPKDRAVTYASFVCDHRPLKSEQYRIRLVVGGDKLTYEADSGSPAAGLLETKILLNSVISDANKGARFFTADIKDYFLSSPMDYPEYMRIPFHRFPPDIVKRYKLNELLADDGYIYIKIKKGMYGLRQAAILAYRHLVKNLAPYGYSPCKYSSGLWKHKTRKTIFCLCVDDFGVKYFNEEDKNHLLNALNDHYKITIDDDGRHYCGLTIDWAYDKGYVDISMPGYSEKVRERLGHLPPSKPQYAPHQWYKPTYGQKTQLTRDPDTSPFLSKKDITFIQSGVGAYLYYGRAVEHPMLVALNEIGHSQSKPTENTFKALRQLLDYAATRPDAKIRFYASDMILLTESDAAYLVLPNAKSRVAGYYYLSKLGVNPPRNGPIWIECRTLPLVASSAAEAETGALFINAQRIIPIRLMLEEIGHPQPEPTPLKTDNSTANGFCNKTIKQKQSKAWNMRYHWLREKELKQQIRIYWDKGSNNLADYFTKHFPAKYHQAIRPKYILSGYLAQQGLTSVIEPTLRGCVDSRARTSNFQVSRPPQVTVG